MAIIKRQSLRQSIINFNDFDIRVFVKYRNGLANQVRIWKLPPNSKFWHMFNSKNLIWFISEQKAKYLHGWFSEEGNLLEILTKKIANCKNFEEFTNLLLDFERTIEKGIALNNPKD